MTRTISVLHVDGDPETAGRVAVALHETDERLDVIAVSNAADALDRLRTETFDCVVSSDDLDGTTGVEFLETVRGLDEDLPFVLLADDGEEGMADREVPAGVTELLRRGSGVDQYEQLADRIVEAVDRDGAEPSTSETGRWMHELSEATNDILWMFSHDWRELLFINSAYADIWGRSTEPLRERPTDFLNGVHPDDRARVENAMERLSSGESVDIEFRVNAEEAYGRWVWVQGEPITDASGRVRRVAGFARDVTERKRRERTLEELQNRTHRLLTAADDEEIARVAVSTAHEVIGAPMCDCYLLASDGTGLERVAFVDTAGGETDDAPGSGGIGDDTVPPVLFEALENDEQFAIDDTDARADGSPGVGTKVRSAIVQPLTGHGVLVVSATEPNGFDDTDRALVDILSTSVTATLDRAEREEELRAQNDRLDRFASIVSHDLRNPLTVIAGRLELARAECESDHLDEMADALDRSQALIDEMLAVAREGGSIEGRETVAIGDIVEEFWAAAAPDDATVEVVDEVVLEGDPNRIRRACENLLRNSIEHGSADDRSTEGPGEDDGGVTVRIGTIDGTGFYVEDDGPGIPAADREDVFRDGYTTADGNTGLGLVTVREVVESHGWEISVTESDMGGARFEITGIDREP